MPEMVSRKKTAATNVLSGWIKHGPHWDSKRAEYGWYYSAGDERVFMPSYSPVFPTFHQVLDWLAENVKVCPICSFWLRRVEGDGVCSDCQEQAAVERMETVETPDREEVGATDR